jgi:hypothetical protein
MSFCKRAPSLGLFYFRTKNEYTSLQMKELSQIKKFQVNEFTDALQRSSNFFT